MKNFLFKLLCIVLTIAFVMLIPHIIGIILYPLKLIAGPLLDTDTGIIIFVVVVFVGLNVLSYFASYVWGNRKPWFFWLGLCLTIIFMLMAISAAITS